MTVQIIRGDALHLPLADQSVDLVCTSPPYFALRSYTDAGQHYAGQIGSENTPQEWLDALWAATAEMVRVLKPGGSIFVNLGDKYAGSRMDGSNDNGTGSSTLVGTPSIRKSGRRDGALMPHDRSRTNMPAKSLMLLPERYRIGAVDRLGLIARAVIIWDKPNGLPESVTDRVRRSHEDWIHLTKQPRYYSAIDEIREPQVGGVVSGGGAKRGRGHGGDMLAAGTFSKDGGFNAYREQNGVAYNPLGKLPSSVWTIPTEPLTVPPELGVDHFAAYPTEWPRRIIQGWTPTGICTECGQGRRPVAERGGYDPAMLARRGNAAGDRRAAVALNTNPVNLSGPEKVRWRTPDTISGYVCGCGTFTTKGYRCDSTPDGSEPESAEPIAATNGQPATESAVTQPAANAGYGDGSRSSVAPPTRPAVVLDPFMGTGTTLLAATVLGRDAIGIDLSADYCQLARWRVNNPDQRARAARVDKPPPVIDGQLSLAIEETSWTSR